MPLSVFSLEKAQRGADTGVRKPAGQEFDRELLQKVSVRQSPLAR